MYKNDYTSTSIVETGYRVTDLVFARSRFDVFTSKKVHGFSNALE